VQIKAAYAFQGGTAFFTSAHYFFTIQGIRNAADKELTRHNKALAQGVEDDC
jgi:hypothetical protein